MVGRLIEQQHVVRRQAEGRERHACLLATAQRANPPNRLLTHEAKRAHHGAATLLSHARVELTHLGRDISEGELFLRKLLRKVLSKDAEAQPLIRRARPRLHRQ